jgi:hypothetical protein
VNHFAYGFFPVILLEIEIGVQEDEADFHASCLIWSEVYEAKIRASFCPRRGSLNQSVRVSNLQCTGLKCGWAREPDDSYRLLDLLKVFLHMSTRL